MAGGGLCGVACVVWLAWWVFGMTYRYRTEPNRHSAIRAIQKPLNTAYVSVSTEPPDYNHVNTSASESWFCRPMQLLLGSGLLHPEPSGAAPEAML